MDKITINSIIHKYNMELYVIEKDYKAKFSQISLDYLRIGKMLYDNCHLKLYSEQPCIFILVASLEYMVKLFILNNQFHELFMNNDISAHIKAIKENNFVENAKDILRKLRKYDHHTIGLPDALSKIKDIRNDLYNYLDALKIVKLRNACTHSYNISSDQLLSKKLLKLCCLVYELLKSKGVKLFVGENDLFTQGDKDGFKDIEL